MLSFVGSVPRPSLRIANSACALFAYDGCWCFTNTACVVLHTNTACVWGVFRSADQPTLLVFGFFEMYVAIDRLLQ